MSYHPAIPHSITWSCYLWMYITTRNCYICISFCTEGIFTNKSCTKTLWTVEFIYIYFWLWMKMWYITRPTTWAIDNFTIYHIRIWCIFIIKNCTNSSCCCTTPYTSTEDISLYIFWMIEFRSKFCIIFCFLD